MLDHFLMAIDEYMNTPLIHRPVKYGGLDVTETGVALQLIPTGPGERYFNGRTDRVNFQVLTKFLDNREALQKIGQIAERLTQVGRGEIVIEGGEYLVISCDVYTSPTPVEKTDKNEYVYSAFFTAEIQRKRRH